MIGGYSRPAPTLVCPAVTYISIKGQHSKAGRYYGITRRDYVIIVDVEQKRVGQAGLALMEERIHQEMTFSRVYLRECRIFTTTPDP